jgi:hypothetical protein
MLSFSEFVKDNILFEEKEAGGKGADLRGDTSEYAFYHAAQNYNAEKRKHLQDGKSDEEAHSAAVEHLRNPEHMAQLKKKVAKSSPKTSQHHESNKEDFHHTVEDGSHAAADYLHKMHREHGSIDSSRDHIITGPQGEKKTASEIGITNADMVTPITRKNGEKVYAKVNISNRNKSVGSSLKYATAKSKHIKVRTHGEAAFHDIVHQAAKKVLGKDHPDVKELNRLHGKKHQEKKKLAEGEWKNNPDLHSHLDSMKSLFQKHHDKKDLPGSFEGAKSHLRKIIRGGSRDVKDASKVTDSDKKKAREHLDALEKSEESYKKSRLDHVNHATKVLNKIYDEGGEGKKEANTQIHRMHRKLVGVFGRRTGTSDVEIEKGRKEKVPVIRTHLVSITRGKRGERPHTGIHSLTNRLEDMSRDSSKKYRASSTEGGTINFHHGDDHWASHSLDKGSGHMMKIAPKKTAVIKKPGK